MSEISKELSREREGLQLAQYFIEYCYGVGEMFSLPQNVAIIEACQQYADSLCDNCGGAMSCDPCPVHRYKEDFKQFLDGERTVFAKEIRKDN